MRASNVVYDRAHSSISTATADEFNFDEIFADADWFHFTGITPAVSDAAIELTEAALKAAKAHGVTVSVDLNFRKKLWSSEKAQKVMTNLMKTLMYVSVTKKMLSWYLASSPAIPMLPAVSWSWLVTSPSSSRWLTSQLRVLCILSACKPFRFR